MQTSPKSAYGQKIYEGKAKVVYQTVAGRLIHYFKDSATAFNAQKKAEFEGKGELNLEMSTLFFTYLKSQGIESHFIKKIDERSFESLELKMLPVEVVVRNVMAGSLAKRLQEKEGAPINPPIVEFYLKDDAKGDPLVSEDVLVSVYQQKIEELNQIRKMALGVNEKLTDLSKRAGLTLVDFKLEFGKTSEGKIILADEISPDTCRFWDPKTQEKLDKDRFRFDLGDLLTGYREVLKRLKGALKGV